MVKVRLPASKVKSSGRRAEALDVFYCARWVVRPRLFFDQSVSSGMGDEFGIG